VARRRRELDAAKAFYDGTDRKTAREILVRLRGELTPGPDRARALLALGLLHSLGGEHTAAKQACAQAIEDARGEARLQAEAHLHFALVCYDDQLAARQSVAAARALVEADPDAPNDLVAAVLLDDAYQGLYLGEGLAEAQVARGLARLPRHRETWLAQRARAVAEAWAKYTDDLLRARELLQESSDREREEGDEVSWSLTIRHLCEVECWLGNWRRAQELATAAHDAMPDANALYGCGLVAAHLGEVAEARHAAEAGLAVASSPWGRATNLSVLGFLELSLGNAAAAVQHLEAAAATVAEAGMPEPVRFRFDGDRVEALVAVGRLAEAEKVVEQLAQRAAATPRPWNRVMHARGLALVRAAKGDLDGALDALERALREHERLPMPFERARTLLHLGALRRRRNERRAAHDTLSSALEIFETLGAPLWAAQAEEELRRIPIRRKATDNTLTPTEERVAELAASGRTNREVARTLFMSPKTVEANLSRVYRKLEIRSRAELGAVMAARSEGAAASKP
jgi:DNA-binding NarL/FixJ family response regulator